MFKFLRRNKKGFTLIELIVVIAILAILAAIAIPAFMGITDQATASVNLANAKTIATALNANNALYIDSQKETVSGETGWISLPTNLKPTGMPTGEQLTKIEGMVKYDSASKSFYVEAASTSSPPATT